MDSSSNEDSSLEDYRAKILRRRAHLKRSKTLDSSTSTKKDNIVSSSSSDEDTKRVKTEKILRSKRPKPEDSDSDDGCLKDLIERQKKLKLKDDPRDDQYSNRKQYSLRSRSSNVTTTKKNVESKGDISTPNVEGDCIYFHRSKFLEMMGLTNSESDCHTELNGKYIYFKRSQLINLARGSNRLNAGEDSSGSSDSELSLLSSAVSSLTSDVEGRRSSSRRSKASKLETTDEESNSDVLGNDKEMKQPETEMNKNGDSVQVEDSASLENERTVEKDSVSLENEKTVEKDSVSLENEMTVKSNNTERLMEEEGASALTPDDTHLMKNMVGNNNNDVPVELKESKCPSGQFIVMKRVLMIRCRTQATLPQIFFSLFRTNANVDHTIAFLNDKDTTHVWRIEEDKVLIENDVKGMRKIIAKRGVEAVQKRRKFLQLC